MQPLSSFVHPSNSSRQISVGDSQLRRYPQSFPKTFQDGKDPKVLGKSFWEVRHWNTNIASGSSQAITAVMKRACT